ncbi:DUF4249 domain-containing protein [Flavobacterium sp. MC2016-06]|jgi:hypothetical protein|uniref:DUF4249 domain-containing protein n=1 Tax=Flavobacterium sp. MC2016-06 TaxID=2676308 RepID=UPI0012BAC45E|nr:DUF4249 domain-containing protein [Flavobacterium sp. MC2016-06]MBU3857993.1 DUF4249 domain-containing protein [Flavobacterium sp. MC2016-06]
MKKILLYRLLAVLFLTSTIGCTNPYNYEAKGFEDVIVIQAMITNQYKLQEIKLSRTYTLEENTPTFETKATVYITDDAGNKYEFKESDGSYISTSEFQALPDRQYQLHVTTKDGRSYLSTTEKLTTQTQIESLEATAVTKNDILGVQITANSFDPTNTSKYYKYEYEETSKIVAPNWYPLKAVATMFPSGANPKGQITFEERTTEARICFLNNKSDAILLTSTNDLSEDRVTSFPVRFIPSTDNFIRNRYSILVKQYVQSLAGHTFDETLKNISNTGSLLSQTQPGFFSGNIQSVDNPTEKVIGFFEVCSYSEKRLFFNYKEIFPKERIPEYQYYCPVEIPEAQIEEYYFTYCFSNNPNAGCQGNLILDFIYNNVKVFVPNESPSYLLYPIQCGDCTSFSSNIKPSFWID